MRTYFCAAITAVLLLAGACFLSAQATEGNAEGTLVINAKSINLHHAYAAVVPDAFDKTKEGTVLFITDSELPAGALTDDIEMMHLERDGKIHGLRFEFSSDKQPISGSLISNNLDGSVSGSWTNMFHVTTFDDKSITGEAVTSPRTVFKNSFEYSVKVEAPIVRAVKAPKASASDISAAEASPQAAVYRRYRKAMDSGNLNELRAVVIAEHKKDIDRPEFPKMLEMVKMLSATDVKLQKLTVDGAHSTLTAIGKDRVSNGVSDGTITFQRENGEWKLVEERWRGSGSNE